LQEFDRALRLPLLGTELAQLDASLEVGFLKLHVLIGGVKHLSFKIALLLLDLFSFEVVGFKLLA
jgi:hypothetical protein